MNSELAQVWNEPKVEQHMCLYIIVRILMSVKVGKASSFCYHKEGKATKKFHVNNISYRTFGGLFPKSIYFEK